MLKNKQNHSHKSASPIIVKNISNSDSIITRSRALLNCKKGISPNASIELKQGGKNYKSKAANKNKSDVSLQTCLQSETQSSIIQTDISFKSIQVTNELLSRNWISDDTLHQYFDLLNDLFLNNDLGLIINPIISHAVKSVIDFEHFLDPLNIREKNLLLIPINDSENLCTIGDGGTHWSTLIYEKVSKLFYYYDSITNHNLSSAKLVANKMSSYLNNQNGHAKIIVIEGPQQSNGYDCGMYVICAVETLLAKITQENKTICSDELQKLKLTEADIIKKRALLAYILNNKTNMSRDILSSLMLTELDRNKNNTNRSHNGLTPNNIGEEGSYCRASGKKQEENGQLSSSQTHQTPLTLQTNDSNKQKLLNEYPTIDKPRVLIVADSHGRRCSEFLKEELKGQFVVTSIIKPNAPYKEVTKHLNNLACTFTKKDYVLVMGGTNDVPLLKLDEKDGVKDTIVDLEELTNLTEKTNLILPSIPYRFDKPSYNDIIKKLNEKLNKRILDISHKTNIIPMPSISMGRSDHTTHGLHLNSKGKRKLCHSIAKLIRRNRLAVKNSQNEVNSSFMDSSMFPGFSDQSIVDSQHHLDLCTAWDETTPEDLTTQQTSIIADGFQDTLSPDSIYCDKNSEMTRMYDGKPTSTLTSDVSFLENHLTHQ